MMLSQCLITHVLLRHTIASLLRFFSNPSISPFKSQNMYSLVSALFLHALQQGCLFVMSNRGLLHLNNAIQYDHMKCTRMHLLVCKRRICQLQARSQGGSGCPKTFSCKKWVGFIRRHEEAPAPTYYSRLIRACACRPDRYAVTASIWGRCVDIAKLFSVGEHTRMQCEKLQWQRAQTYSCMLYRQMCSPFRQFYAHTCSVAVWAKTPSSKFWLSS